MSDKPMNHKNPAPDAAEPMIPTGEIRKITMTAGVYPGTTCQGMNDVYARSFRTSHEMECTVIEADFDAGTVTLKMTKPFRIGAGRHWLLTDDAYDKLASAGDPPAIA